MVNPSLPDPGGRRPSWSPGPGLVASGVILLVALLGFALVGIRSLWTDNDRDEAQATSEPSLSASAAPDETGADPSCPTDTDQTIPPAPPDVVWEDLGYFEVPDGGDRFGPCVVSDTTSTGYAQTPSGALVAAVQILIHLGIVDPLDVALETASTQFVDNDDRDALVANIEAAGNDGYVDTTNEFAAYKFVSFSPDTAVFSLAETSDTMPGQYGVFSVVMRWIDGDWRMVAPTGGTWKNTGELLVQLPGYTMWGPE